MNLFTDQGPRPGGEAAVTAVHRSQASRPVSRLTGFTHGPAGVATVIGTDGIDSLEVSQ